MKNSLSNQTANRKFGFLLVAVLAALGAFFSIEGNKTFGLWSLVGCFFALFVTLVRSELLGPINKLWMRLGFVMGLVISPIVLAVLFFGLFTPISVFTRMFGRDELNLELKKRSSHWIERDQRHALFSAFEKQY